MTAQLTASIRNDSTHDILFGPTTEGPWADLTEAIAPFVGWFQTNWDGLGEVMCRTGVCDKDAATREASARIVEAIRGTLIRIIANAGADVVCESEANDQ